MKTKLSEELQQLNNGGHCGMMVEGFAERAREMESLLEAVCDDIVGRVDGRPTRETSWRLFQFMDS